MTGETMACPRCGSEVALLRVVLGPHGDIPLGLALVALPRHRIARTQPAEFVPATDEVTFTAAPYTECPEAQYVVPAPPRLTRENDDGA